MYWSTASTPDGNGELMKEKWKMLPLHIQNIHTNPHNDTYPGECGHGDLEGDAKNRLWLQPGMPNTRIHCCQLWTKTNLGCNNKDQSQI